MDLVLSLEDSYPWLAHVVAAPIDDAGICFFSHLGYSGGGLPLLGASSRKAFVYSHLPEGHLLDDFDRCHMSSIHAGTHLFDWSTDDYPESSDSVGVFAVDMEDVGYARSEEACAVHRIMSKFSTKWSIVLFRHQRSLLLSFLRPANAGSCTIYLSDWISCDTPDLGQLERIHITSTSLKSPIDCFDGFMYEAIRPYYKEPLTRSSVAYGIMDMINVSTKIDLPLISREDLDDAIDKAMYYYVGLYGDDYIEDETLEIDDEDDFNLEDAEWELENSASDNEDERLGNQHEMFSSRNDYHDTSAVNVEDIPDEIMANPISLLNWLEEHPPANVSTDSANHASELRVIPVGEVAPKSGMYVRHITLGTGLIIRSEPTYIEVDFNGIRRVLKFPAAFNASIVELLGSA